VGADKQAESTLERNRLSAIAKIKQDLAWRSVAGVPMSQIVITQKSWSQRLSGFRRVLINSDCSAIPGCRKKTYRPTAPARSRHWAKSKNPAAPAVKREAEEG
jgi:hypothetical protein